MDGHHILVSRDRILTRNGIDIKDKLEFMGLDLPGGMVLAGELYGDFPSTSVKTAINEQWDSLRFTAFAMPEYDCNDATYMDLFSVKRIVNDYGFEFVETSRYNPNIDYLATIPPDQEGYVFKEHNYRGWYKVKPVQTLDLKVIAIKKSWSATHFGDMKAAICVNAKGKVIADVGTGWEHHHRQMDLVGKIIEVRHDGFAANGRLLFPRFLRIRDDKEWADG
jgi:hypothetical protein